MPSNIHPETHWADYLKGVDTPTLSMKQIVLSLLAGTLLLFFLTLLRLSAQMHPHSRRRCFLNARREIARCFKGYRRQPGCAAASSG